MPQPTHAIAGLGLQRQVSCLGLHRSAWPSLALWSFWLHPLLRFLLQRQPEDMETGSLFRRQGCGAMSCDLFFLSPGLQHLVLFPAKCQSRADKGTVAKIFWSKRGENITRKVERERTCRIHNWIKSLLTKTKSRSNQTAWEQEVK